MDNTQFADVQDFDVQRQQLARRRKLAEQLLATRNTPDAKLVNGRAMFGMGPGQILANGVDNISGNLQQPMLDTEEQQLGQREREQQQRILSSIPASGPERQQALLMAGNAMPSLRNSISALLAADERAAEAERNRIEKGEQAAADRVSKAESEEKYRRTFDQAMSLKQAPTSHITIQTGGGGKGGVKAPSGYRYNEDGSALEPIPGGPADKQPGAKPLTAKDAGIQRSYTNMEKSLNQYETLLDQYDPQSTGALSPTQRASLESAFTDVQMKLKELYDLGAPQAGDMRLLEQSFANPTSLQGTVKGAAFGKSPFKAKVGEIRTLLDNSVSTFDEQKGTTTQRAPRSMPAEKKRLKFNPTTGRVE